MKLPLIINLQHLGAEPSPAIRLVDVRPVEQYQEAHIPGALQLDPKLLNAAQPPVGGLLPDAQTVSQALASIGYQQGDHIVAYDNGAETAAARLVWVMHAYGQFNISWLNGGLKAWQREGKPVEGGPTTATAEPIALSFTPGNVLNVDEVLAQLNDASFAALDVRSEKEFLGEDVRSARGGHMPGAKHAEWTNVFDEHGMLKPDEQLLADLQALSVDRANRVLVYCQTHQRSALSYVVLKHLGFNDVLALDGAWSAWGNREDVPIAT